MVAVTGSCGKTTVRRMIATALTARYSAVHATAGNLNNHVGVPLTLLDAPADADALVLEMGMNAPGEIAELQAIAEPTVRVVTNVGPVHLEGFGAAGIEGVAAAKAELVAGARAGDVCVLNADDARVAAIEVTDVDAARAFCLRS